MEQQTGLENIKTKLTERVDMPADVASEMAESFANGFSAGEWQRKMIGVNEKWGRYGEKRDDPDTVTDEGMILSEDLSKLQSSEVFMDAVIDMTDKLQKDSEKIDWASWEEQAKKAVSIARDVVVRTISEDSHRNSFTTDEEAGKVRQDPEGILKLVGLAMEDAGSVKTENYKSMFDNPTHPAIVEIGKRRGNAGEMKMTNPKSVVEDLGLRQGYGKVAK